MLSGRCRCGQSMQEDCTLSVLLLRWNGLKFHAAFTKWDIPAVALLLTMKARGTKFCCRSFRLRRVRSPMPNIWSSCRITVMAGLNYGYRTDGTRCSLRLGIHHSTGNVGKTLGWNSRFRD